MDLLEAARAAAVNRIEMAKDHYDFCVERTKGHLKVFEDTVQAYIKEGVANATSDFQSAIDHLSIAKPRDLFEELAKSLKRPLVLGLHNTDWRTRWKVELTAPRGKHTENLMSGLLLLSGSVSQRDVISNDSSRQRWRFYFYHDGIEHYEAFRAIMRKDKVARMILNLPKE